MQRHLEKTIQKFNIDRRRLKEWEKNFEAFLKMKFKRNTFRIKSAKDLSKYPDMEKKLIYLINDKRSSGACLSGLSIKQKSMEIHRELYNTIEFKATNGWFLNFCKRRQLTLRRVTTSGRDLPANSQSIIDSFFKECQKLVVDGYSNDEILNMDETSIYLDFPTNCAYTNKGEKKVKSTGGGSQLGSQQRLRLQHPVRSFRS